VFAAKSAPFSATKAQLGFPNLLGLYRIGFGALERERERESLELWWSREAVGSSRGIGREREREKEKVLKRERDG
jgi:hypothetical protein